MKVKTIMKKIVAFAFVGIFGLGMAYVGANYIEEKSGGTVAVEQEQKNDNLVLGNVQENGIKLTMERKQALPSGTEIAENDTTTITATVTTNGNIGSELLEWDMQFYGTLNGWIDEENSGNVSDYVELSVSEDTHVVTLTKKKNFGTKIKLTVTGKNNLEVTASVILDCFKDITALSLWEKEYYLDVGTMGELDFRATVTTGTILPTIQLSDVKITTNYVSTYDSLEYALQLRCSPEFEYDGTLTTTSNGELTYVSREGNTISYTLTTDVSPSSFTKDKENLEDIEIINNFLYYYGYSSREDSRNNGEMGAFLNGSYKVIYEGQVLETKSFSGKNRILAMRVDSLYINSVLTGVTVNKNQVIF